MMLPTLEIVLVAVLLGFSAFFASSETALFSLRPHELRRLESRPSPESLRVVRLAKDPHRFLVAVLVGNTLVNVAASSLGTSILARRLEHYDVAASVVVMSILILVVGEVIPKTYALENPVRLSGALSRPLSAAVRILGPLEGALEGFLRLVLRPRPARVPAHAGRSPERAAEAVTLGHSAGVIDTFDWDVIKGLFKAMHLSVENVMTPRTEVFMLSADLALGEAVGALKASGFSRVPLYAPANRDEIVGVLYVKDILYGRHGSEARLGDIARKPVFVPESKPVVDLASEFASGTAHFAVVIDEYGSFTGIVTIDDILAEITGRGTMGEIARHSYVRRSRSAWEVSGRMELGYLAALTGASFPEGGPKTVGGLVAESLGRIPVRGEQAGAGGLRFTVMRADKRHVEQVLVERIKR